MKKLRYEWIEASDINSFYCYWLRATVLHTGRGVWLVKKADGTYLGASTGGYAYFFSSYKARLAAEKELS